MLKKNEFDNETIANNRCWYDNYTFIGDMKFGPGAIGQGQLNKTFQIYYIWLKLFMLLENVLWFVCI